MERWWCIYFWLCFQVSLPLCIDEALHEEYPVENVFRWVYNCLKYLYFFTWNWTIKNIHCRQIKKNDVLKVTRTWYSLLNPAFSFTDMFEICAMMFLIEIFLLVGGPLFVFSGNTYVESSLPCALLSCGLWSV